MRKLFVITLSLFAFAAIAETSSDNVVAVVNDQIISSTDLNDRVNLVMGMTNIANTPENRSKIIPQIIHQLVDEKLQMQDAEQNSITISEDKVKGGVVQVEQQNHKQTGSLEKFLEEKHLSKNSFLAQLRAQLAWAEIVLKKLRPKIRISDQEVANYSKRKTAPPTRMNNQHVISDVMIEVMVLPVYTPKSENTTRKLAEKLASEIKNGVDFRAVANQFSSKIKTTDAFWIEVAQMDPKIVAALVKVTKGGITEPIRTDAGYQLVKLIDVKQKAVATPAPKAKVENHNEPNTELAFKQILMKLKPDTKKPDDDTLLKTAKEVSNSQGKCDAKTFADSENFKDFDFDVSFVREVSSNLSEQLRDILLNIKVGQVSEPVITPQGIRIFMLCERIDLPSASGQPAPKVADDVAREAIFEEKLELEAQKYMRNLRKEAFIEIRGNN